jgi:hypothetical protein
MRILRAVIRRGSSVGTAGKFTILTPGTWFAASRLPDGIHNTAGHYLTDSVPLNTADSSAAQAPKPAFVSEKNFSGFAGSREVEAPSLIVDTSEHSGLVRPILFVLAAIAITWALLWWIGHPGRL